MTSNLETWSLRDKSRQKQRNKNLQEKKAKQELEPKREKPKSTLKSATTVNRKKTAQQRRAVQTVEDEEELTRDYRLLKKLKKGAIDENEFAMLTGTEDLWNILGVRTVLSSLRCVL